jgi:tRNA (guanine37-N1)-methyltransferase
MEINIFTLFPKIFQGPLNESIVGRALDKGLLNVHIHDFRDYTHDRHRTADDYPYGGGPGMLMKPEPIFEAVESVLGDSPACRIILLTPQGSTFNQEYAKNLVSESDFALICGHYGGVDERVREHLATEELSIGDYVITGGELAAMVVVDAVARLIPGVLGSAEAAAHDSYANGLLQYPQYTRPPDFRGWRVPDILLSGDHQNIANWRSNEGLIRTRQRRPDLLR